MKTIKDNFSVQAEHYAKFRPHYPDELFEYLCLITPQKQTAWDCGASTGHVVSQGLHVRVCDRCQRTPDQQCLTDGKRSVPSRSSGTNYDPRQWNLEHLIGYLNSWTAVQNFIRSKGTHPVDLFEPRLREVWSAQSRKTVRFPLFINVGRVYEISYCDSHR